MTGILIILVSTVVFTLTRNQVNSTDRFVRQINRKIIKVLQGVDRQLDQAKENLKQVNGKEFSGTSIHFLYPTYIFRQGNLVYWSDHSFVPEYYLVSGDFHYAFRESQGSSFIAVKNTSLSDSIKTEIVTLVPLYRKYELTNQYLQSGYNTRIFSHPQISLFPSQDKPDKIYSADHTFLFSMEFYPGYKADAGVYEYFFFILLLAGIVMVVTGIFYQAFYFRKYGKYGVGLVFLLLSLLAVRIVMVSSDFPFSLIEIPAFDHKYYASSFMNSSLGDLFLNMTVPLAFIYFFFRVYTRKNYYHRFYWADKKTSLVYSFLMALFNVIFVLFIFRLVGSLSQHSQWNLDITKNLNYPVYKIFCYFLYFMGAVIFFLGTYINNSLFFRLQKFKIRNILVIQLAGGLFSIVITFFLDYHVYLPALIAFILVLALSVLNFRGIINRLTYKTFVYILIVSILCAASVSISVYQEMNRKNQIDRDRFADQLLQERDILTEYFIEEAVKNIQNDVFIQNRLFSPFASKEIIEDKIRKTYLNNYLERFDVNILLFNGEGQPINNAKGPIYEDFKSRVAVDKNSTDIEGLYYYQQDKPVLVRRYWSFIPISRYRHVEGYIILDLKLKKIIRNKVYPRLLLDERFLSNYYDDQYDYALYNGSMISYTSGNFNYQKDFNPSWLKRKALYEQGIERNGYRHLAYRGEHNKVLVISWERYPLSYALANFSFMFLLQVVGLLVFLAVAGFYFSRGNRRLNYMTRIQLYVNLAFLIPLVIISIITISRISRDYSQEDQDTFLKKAENTGVNLDTYVEQYRENRIGREELYNQVADIATLTESDINIYGLEIQRGKLLATSQPAVFDKHLLSNYINPRALAGIAVAGRTSMILDEKIGDLSYKSAYAAIKSPQSGELQAIISVPFFSSQSSIDRRIINLIVSVINTFTFIFIAFLFISYIISTNLVFPLKQMISRIRFTSLTGNNQPIEYHSPDEIGQLVDAYNGMITKLELSRKALAQSEKEAGWREMAKQVAHEIKNPLTPMKLTLQHMKMRMPHGKGEENSSFEKAVDSMLHNIDTLSSIADSFSNYAKMPVPEVVRFDITGLLKQVAGLYMNNDEAEVSFRLPEEEIYVKGDEYWLGRAFSNLVINSIQAAEGKKAKVEVEMHTSNDKVTVTVRDNGKGIPESIRERIFVPNFSTKFTGSGIGLAVTRRAVEHAGGRIWFDSKLNIGTTFYIELPVEA